MMECQELEKTTTEAIGAYCRVLEIHIRAVAEGADPSLQGDPTLRATVRDATAALGREVQFLRFLREKMHDEVRGSREET